MGNSIRIVYCVLVLLVSLFVEQVQAQKSEQNTTQKQAQKQAQKLEVELITISPGEYYWEAFGHSALRIKNAYDDRLFGFGYFNFNEENFFLNFAKGNMRYFLGVDITSYEWQNYQSEGRKITRQSLDLSAQQKRNLLNKLIFLSQPENRYYHYDYFLNNCTSIIRDLLDDVTSGEISRQLESMPSQQSWASLTFPVEHQAWMNLGIAIIYGLPAFEAKNQWQLSVFPETFSDDLFGLETQTQWNKQKNIIYQPEIDTKSSLLNDFMQTHYAMLMLVVILLLLLLASVTRRWTLNVWLLIQSILGSLLLVVWIFTQHHIAAWNLNILLFFPLAFVLVLPKYRGHKQLILLFLFLNALWFIGSMIFTMVYLMGFFLVNCSVAYFLLKSKATSQNI